MRIAVALLALPVMLGAASVASAQVCATPAQPAFDFQVDRPVAFVGDSAQRPRPSTKPFRRSGDGTGTFLVQFVVDTLGHPVAATFRVLSSPTPVTSDMEKKAMTEWRFTPAMKAGCKVPQLVQTPVDR